MHGCEARVVRPYRLWLRFVKKDEEIIYSRVRLLYIALRCTPLHRRVDDEDEDASITGAYHGSGDPHRAGNVVGPSRVRRILVSRRRGRPRRMERLARL